MSNDIQNITRASLGKTEAKFLSQIGAKRFFTIEETRKILGHKKGDPASQFLERLKRKGWIFRIKRGLYVTVPLSAGEETNPQVHEFHVAMHLVSPAAIAYWTALNHHGMTEQLPRTVFIATNHLVRHPPKEVIWFSYRIVSLRPQRFFGIVQDWIDEGPFNITGKEKTIIDGLDLPEYVGGVGEIAKALCTSWKQLNKKKLFQYAVRMGSAALERVPPVGSTVASKGKHSRRWGLLVNVEEIE